MVTIFAYICCACQCVWGGVLIVMNLIKLPHIILDQLKVFLSGDAGPSSLSMAKEKIGSAQLEWTCGTEAKTFQGYIQLGLGTQVS